MASYLLYTSHLYLHLYAMKKITLSAGVVEYTNCTSVER